MGVKTNIHSVVSNLRKIHSNIEQQVQMQLVKVGEQVVEIARSTKTYEDQSGNLTASIGYGVFRGHNLIASGGFDYGKDGGAMGAAALLAHAPQLSQSQYGIVVVAGMEYATYVERSGYVVLDGAKLRMDGIVQNLLNQIKLGV